MNRLTVGHMPVDSEGFVDPCKLEYHVGLGRASVHQGVTVEPEKRDGWVLLRRTSQGYEVRAEVASLRRKATSPGKLRLPVTVVGQEEWARE